MKILWITYIMLPKPAQYLGREIPASGGWIAASLERIGTVAGMEMGVAIPYAGKDFIHKRIEKIDYWLVPVSGSDFTKYNVGQNQYFRLIRDEFQPDIIHIHGTEFPHGLNWMNACGEKGVVVSLQGIISVIAEYYKIDGGPRVPLSIRDFLRHDGIASQQNKFRRRGQIEKEILRRTHHIIGRTDWDRIHAWAINPEARYHFVGETLRSSFYTSHKWNYAECEKHSIFISQGSYPIKGLHMMLRAIPLILREFPGVHLYVAGDNPTDLPLWKIGSYGLYLKRLISTLGLSGIITFTGNLSEEEMLSRYLKSNLFVCCSAIENSPNSLGEAQMLGMPHLSSFVGGAPEITGYNSDVLYRYEETEELARKVCDIFHMADSFRPAPFDAERYDSDKNLNQLLAAYKAILSNAPTDKIYGSSSESILPLMASNPYDAPPEKLCQDKAQ